MKASKLILPVVAISFLITTGFTGTVRAACLAPNAVDYSGSPVNSLYTDVDGKLDGCPTGYTNGCFIEKNQSSCTFQSTYPPDPSVPGTTSGVIVTVTRAADSGYTTQCSYQDPVTEEYGDIGDCDKPAALVDFAGTKGGQGSNACLTSFDQDVASFSAGFDGAGFFGAYLCGDAVYENAPPPPPPPAPDVSSCILQAGQSIDIYGVAFTCSGVPDNEQRTIIVSQDLVCDENGLNCSVPPTFGFTGADGIPHFENFCICLGNGTPITDPQCDPNPLITNDPVTDALEACTTDAGAFPPVEISIQNPRCVTGGADRRCY